MNFRLNDRARRNILISISIIASTFSFASCGRDKSGRKESAAVEPVNDERNPLFITPSKEFDSNTTEIVIKNDEYFSLKIPRNVLTDKNQISMNPEFLMVETRPSRMSLPEGEVAFFVIKAKKKGTTYIQISRVEFDDSGAASINIGKNIKVVIQ